MYRVREITTPLTELQEECIFNLVFKNAECITTYKIEKSSPFYSFISAREVSRTMRYLHRTQETNDLQTHLIVGEDLSGNIIGFLLFNKDRTCASDVSICSTIVAAEYRQQGIFRDMINQLKSKYQSISLSCFPELVSFYEKFDFRVEGQYETHIGMTWGTLGGEDEYWGIDDDEVDELPQVRQSLQAIENELGQSFARKFNRLRMDSIRAEKAAAAFIIDHKNRNS